MLPLWENKHVFFRLLFPEIQYIRGSLSTGEMQEQLCTELFLIIWKPPKTLRRKNQKGQYKRTLYSSVGVQIYTQCFSLIQCCTTWSIMLNFRQISLDQAVHCCNLLALSRTGELDVADGSIWSKKVLMYSNWSLKKIFE